jgi:hypothetical protein
MISYEGQAEQGLFDDHVVNDHHQWNYLFFIVCSRLLSIPYTLRFVRSPIGMCGAALAAHRLMLTGQHTPALQVRLSHHEPGRTPLQSALEHEIENAVQRMQINFFPVGQALSLYEMFSLDELREEVNALLNEDEAGGDYDGGGLL